jgi:hypothetical protein
MCARAAKILQTLECRPSSAQYEEYEMEETNLPVNYEEDTDDGYTPVETSDRTVVGNLIKYTSDNGWTESGLQVESNKKLAALAVNKVLQRWQEERVIETIAQKPLPDAEEMNAAIPEIEWDKGPDGKPRPPWQLAHIVYLLDIETCEKFTFVSASIGAKIAVCALQDRVAWMRKLRGADVVPQVELSFKPMSTRFGMRKRPDFKIVGWLDLRAGAGASPSALHQLPPIELNEVAPPTTAEEMNDALPF